MRSFYRGDNKRREDKYEATILNEFVAVVTFSRQYILIGSYSHMMFCVVCVLLLHVHSRKALKVRELLCLSPMEWSEGATQIADFVRRMVAEQIHRDVELFVTCPHLQLVYKQSQNFVYRYKFAILSTSVY